jgi:general secretion pathway protein D
MNPLSKTLARIVLLSCLAAFTEPHAVAAQQQPASAEQATPPATQAAPATPQAAPVPPAAGSQPAGEARISLDLANANLTDVIRIIAAELKMNYVVDPAVKGIVNVTTMGDLRQEDLLGLLQTILRANGAVAVESGGVWRIVPAANAPRVPVAVSRNLAAGSIPADDRMVMNVVPLAYVTAADMSEILKAYLSEAGQIVRYDPGNVLLITETSRNMKRLMDLIAMFDTDALAQQRLRLFPVENAQASQLVLDLRDIFSAYALSDKSAVKFLPIGRINSILVVSGNPNVFNEVQQWVEKLDKPVRRTGIQNFVYRVENASAENLAAVLNGLYGAGGGVPQTRPQAGTGALSAAGTMSGFGTPGYSGAGMAAGQMPLAASMPSAAAAQQPATSEVVALPGGMLQSGVRIVADTVNNALIIQATPQDYEIIRQTLKELDTVPRQVMIEAKVYEVTLTGALSFGVEYFLEHRSEQDRRAVGQFALGANEGRAGLANPGLSLSAGTLVGRSRELLAFLNAQENRSRTKVVSAPTVLASDNQEARIQVGAEVPILTSQGVMAGAQMGGTSVFTNTVQQRDTGVILSVVPRINSSGLVSLRIGQEVSQALAPTVGTIQSPTIQKRSVLTQATVQDGETIALGGIISENNLFSKNRIPLLGDIPVLGVLFGSTSTTNVRTELIVLLTPRVIQTVAGAADATNEFRDRLKEIKKAFKELSDDKK